MEDKRVLFSALGLGFGVGLGMGFAATGRSRSFEKCSRDASSPHSRELIELELRKRVVDGKESNVTFDQFPYYLSEQTRVLLTNAGFLYLKKEPFIKHAKGLSPASRAILLSGPAEAYHQMLAKAVAHLFEAKLLLLDITTLNLKLQSRHGGPSDSTSKSLCETALERVTGLLGSFSSLPTRLPPKTSESGLWRQNSNVELQATIPEDCTLKRLKNSGSESDLSRLAATPSQGPLKRSNSLSALALDDKLLVQSLYKVLTSVSRTGPVILYLRDVERLLFRSQKAHHLFHKLITKISGPVLILGSRIVHPCDQQNEGEINERLTLLFPYNIDIKPPDDNVHLVSWTSQLEEDMKEIQFQDNKNHMSEVLAANDIECDDLSSICFGDVLLSDYIEEIVVSAMSHHLMNTPEPKYHDGRLVISSKSLEHALKIFNAEKVSSKSSLQKEGNGKISQDGKKADTKCEAPTPECKPVGVRAEYAGRDPSVEDASKTAREPKEGIPPMAPSKPEVAPDNEFEKRIRPTVIPASEVGVSFADIGALENVKEALQELVMLPLRRPDLFKGGLLKPCRGILLFGPPGTGKTMLAKALATEAGASFINVSMSTITSKWFGEDEKNVKALFTLAAKVSPTVIFIDEVDSMLGQRTRVGEHEAMRKIKNEFMMNWDGLLTKPAERILVLAATNRPFDLDEAIIRRFERRIIVGLPTVENREKILRALLAKENLEVGFDFKELATITEGYTGSDLKNICTTAAYRPIRDLIKKEKLKEKAKMKDDLKVSSAEKEDSLSSEEHHALRNDATEIGITLRPLAMEDMKEAKNQVSASFASEGACMNELKQWNELYGEGGSRKKEQLSYFL